ncbi:FAD-dependent oxidoreductase [Alkalihalobacillus sp. CinArs1]|uniref:FAD-dependent oxidoreductase n=1 Tax=Alkalihalobacillus sp. CinArs1 TaxID=2995314 RepID=UPI0022DE3FC3|nr:FAD/NAD(P)-binding protein [Alkalihalobacillus sp. CinArs1]
MYNWIIIGGGIHGCTIAATLLKSGKVKKEELLMIDPHSVPLARWKERTGRIQMPFLRSPSVHHIDVPPFSLEKYAKEKSYTNPFYGYYDRPALNLFNEHADSVLREVGLQEVWCSSKVVNVAKEGPYWEIETEDGRIYFAKNCVIAIGNNELAYPDWGDKLKNAWHLFDPRLDMEKITPPIAIVGGGITAAHAAITMANRFPGKVSLITRHPFRVHDFDSDPGWIGPKYLNGYEKVACYRRRRRMIKEARHRGSIPSELHQKLNCLEKQGSLSIIQSNVTSVCWKSNALFITEGSMMPATTLFATGFQAKMPQQKWLQNLIENEVLPCAACGYPIVEKTLEWSSRLFVSGPLAELEIGPGSRNIIGARKAAERIAKSI